MQGGLGGFAGKPLSDVMDAQKNGETLLLAGGQFKVRLSVRLSELLNDCYWSNVISAARALGGAL